MLPPLPLVAHFYETLSILLDTTVTLYSTLLHQLNKEIMYWTNFFAKDLCEHIFRDTSIYIVNLQEFLEIPKAQKKVQTDYCLVEEKGPLIIPLVFLHFLLNTLWITEKENLHLECISNSFKLSLFWSSCIYSLVCIATHSNVK